MDKRAIDKIRDSGGGAEIGTIEDGAIIELFEINGRLIVIKERSIYEMINADDVDPERTNINLPNNIHRLIIKKGTESEVVSRTLLTAKTILKSEYIKENINCEVVLSLIIDILSEISILETDIDNLQIEEKNSSLEYEKRIAERKSFQLPTIVNLESRCKTIFQKTDHIEQILMEIITNFYSDQGLTKQSHFPRFHEVIKSKYGEKDRFTDFIGNTVYFMRIIRELRNGLDHRLATTKVADFELQKNGDIHTPTIEMTFKDVKLNKMSLNEFLAMTLSNLILITEMTLVFLAEKNVKTTGMPYQIREIPEEKRKNKFVRFCFWMPVGTEGYYCQ